MTFKEPPLIAYRKGPTLGTILSKTSLTHNTESEPGFYHRNRPNCSTCEHSTCISDFTSSSSNESNNILKIINCNSANTLLPVLYAINNTLEKLEEN